MLPVDFKEANITLTKPKGWTDEECFELRAYKGPDGDGQPCFVTVWKPSKEDLEALNAGRGVVIKTIGTGFAPMAVWTVDENGEIN